MNHRMTRLLSLGICAVSLLWLTGCQTAAPFPTDPTATEQSAAESPHVEVPVTWPSITEATTEMPPGTEPPSTEIPTTETPTTSPPVTEPPTTEAPTTSSPVTEPPTTEAPTTSPPVTEPPTTEAPTTSPPVTEPPSTEIPTTETPTSAPPATEAPTTEAPATEPPTTEASATEAPTSSPSPLAPDHSKGQEAFQLQNERLAENDVPLLQWSEALYEIAAQRAVEISTDYSHDGCPDWVGENILVGTGSAPMAIQVWYDSDGHRRNMLAGWTYGAIANYGNYWVAIFAMVEAP